MDAPQPGSRWYVAILAAVSSAILIGGWWARPRDASPVPASVPTETELQQLARRAERRALDNTTQFFAGVARDVSSSIVMVPSTGASGIAWDASRIVTNGQHDARAAGTIEIVAAQAVQADVAIWGPNLPLSVLTLPQDGASILPARRSGTLPAMGDWIVAVWRTPAGPAYDVGHVRQITNTACGDLQVQDVTSSLPLTTRSAGGGVFDLDGGLLAVIVACPDRLVAMATTSVESVLLRSTSPEQRLETRYGLTARPLSAEEQDYFKRTDGVLVQSVWIDHDADRAGIWPGDIVTAVDGRAVATVSDVAAGLAAEDARQAVTVWRRGKRLTIPLAAANDAMGSGDTHAGLVLEHASSNGYPIKTVRPGSRAAEAGFQPGDRLLRIDFAQPRTAADVERVINTAAPRGVWVELIRHGRRLGLLLS